MVTLSDYVFDLVGDMAKFLAVTKTKWMLPLDVKASQAGQHENQLEPHSKTGNTGYCGMDLALCRLAASEHIAFQSVLRPRQH